MGRRFPRDNAEVIGAVLNGGGSSRMGVDKARLVLDGRTLLDRTVGLLDAVAGEVVVVGGSEAPPGVPLIEDLVPGSGPIGGLAAALVHAGGDDVLCLAVDLPLVTERTLRSLVGPPLMDAQARVVRSDGRLHPLCGAYAAGLAHLAESHASAVDRSMMAFLRSVPVLSLLETPPDEMVNINTPADLGLLASLRAGYGAEGRQKP